MVAARSARFIWRAISSALSAENHMFLLGRKTSLERVAAFHLEMDRRL
jgi:CRP/FNR family nitrogen fixation transcriptional regulator